MPNYDFECPRGHITEQFVKMDDRDQPMTCTAEIEVREFSLEQLATSLEQGDAAVKDLQVATDAQLLGDEPMPPPVPVRTELPVDAMPIRKIPCGLRAKRIISHSDPGGMLDHGICANRDAAREGRWDPDRPITRGVRK